MALTIIAMARKRTELMPLHLVVLGRGMWATAVLVTAVAAVGLQMDREARKDSAIVEMVPHFFRGYALETLAREAYANGNNAEGLAYSRELVLRRPVPAESLSLLTNGLLVSGRNDAALSALLLSAQRGWRDRYIQRLMVASAQQADDPRVGSQRLLALWRQGDQSLQTKYLTRSQLSSQRGLTEFAQGIVQDDQWGTGFLIWGGYNLSNQSIGAVAASLARQHVKMDCGWLSNAVRNLTRVGRVRAAITVWSDLCSKGSMTLGTDFSFKGSANAPGPFDWQFPDQAGLDAETIEGAGGTVLSYNNSEHIYVVVAKRDSALGSGIYTARIEVEGDEGLDARPPVLQVSCFTESGASTRPGRIELNRREALFRIPSSGCVGQEFSLSVAPGKGRIHRLFVEPKGENVSLRG
jgi:hypothetical protein